MVAKEAPGLGGRPIAMRRPVLNLIRLQQGTARTDHQGRPGRNPADADHWCHVAIEPDGTQGDSGKIMAGAHDGP